MSHNPGQQDLVSLELRLCLFHRKCRNSRNVMWDMHRCLLCSRAQLLLILLT